MIFVKVQKYWAESKRMKRVLFSQQITRAKTRKYLCLIVVFHLCALLQYCYLGDVKWCIFGVLLLKLLVPFAFEVDGVDQHQPGVTGHDTLDQKILNFI